MWSAAFTLETTFRVGLLFGGLGEDWPIGREHAGIVFK